jgi:hypothetical protein
MAGYLATWAAKAPGAETSKSSHTRRTYGKVGKTNGRRRRGARPPMASDIAAPRGRDDNKKR